MQQTKNVDVNTNISETKNSMERIKQNRRIALFSFWSLNQSEAVKKKKIQKILNNQLIKKIGNKQKMLMLIAVLVRRKIVWQG